MPRIIRETSQGFSCYDIQDEMLKNREIECVGPVDAQSAYSLCRQIRYLQREDREAEIILFINSPGGEVDSGLALYDVMKGVACPVRTVCLGLAASIAAVLFAAGDRRDILPHGRVMIHDPQLASGVEGGALGVQEVSRNLMKTRKVVAGILAQCTGRSLTEIYGKTAKNSFFSAEEAVAFGLADRVIRTL